MQLTQSRRLDFITRYYAIATAVIVFVHSRMMHSDNPIIIQQIIRYLSNFHMPAIFFIAGVLLAYTADRHQSIIKWWKDKCIRLLTPYFVLTLLGFFPKVFMIRRIGERGVELSFLYLLESFIKPQASIWGHFWFIPVYIIMMPVAFVILRYVKNRYSLIVIFIVLVIFNIYRIPTHWLGLSDISYQAVYLFSGIVLSRPLISLSQKSLPKIFLFVLMAINIVMFVLISRLNCIVIDRLSSIVGILTYVIISIVTGNTCFSNSIGKHNLLIYIYIHGRFRLLLKLYFLVLLEKRII